MTRSKIARRIHAETPPHVRQRVRVYWDAYVGASYSEKKMRKSIKVLLYTGITLIAAGLIGAVILIVHLSK